MDGHDLFEDAVDGASGVGGEPTSPLRDSRNSVDGVDTLQQDTTWLETLVVFFISLGGVFSNKDNAVVFAAALVDYGICDAITAAWVEADDLVSALHEHAAFDLNPMQRRRVFSHFISIDAVASARASERANEQPTPPATPQVVPPNPKPTAAAAADPHDPGTPAPTKSTTSGLTVSDVTKLMAVGGGGASKHTAKLVCAQNQRPHIIDVCMWLTTAVASYSAVAPTLQMAILALVTLPSLI